MPRKFYHYSKHPDLQEIDPAHFGSNKGVSEEFKHGTSGMLPRSYVYLDQDTPEHIIAQGRHRYEGELGDDVKLYDLQADPEKVVSHVQQKTGLMGRGLADALEHELHGRGYHGYHNPKAGNIAALFQKQKVMRKAAGDAVHQAPAGEKPKNRVLDVAQSYMASKGMPYQVPEQHPKANPERGAKIAAEYHKAKHNPKHPDVQAAYGALINETKDQFQHIKNSGLKMTPIKPGQPNPYPTGSKDLHRDIHENNHIWFYPTDQGFGSGEDSSDHPMLVPTGEAVGDHALLANDMFRIVHDYFGHAKQGHSFGPSGEDAAYRVHRSMYTPLAARALATETRGQNSWVNFGPHGEHNRKHPGATIYAEQKATLLPDWVGGDDDDGQVNKEEIDEHDVRRGSHRGHELASAYLSIRNELKPKKMAKGEAGDWRKEGYKLRHHSAPHGMGDRPGKLHQVTAHDKNGNLVGAAFALEDDEILGGPHLMPFEAKSIGRHAIRVDTDHQRKGLGSAMYALLERKAGKKLRPRKEQTEEGEALWKQPNRPFGKSELEKGAKGDWQKEGYKIHVGRADVSDLTSEDDDDYEEMVDYYNSNPDELPLKVTAHHPVHGQVGVARFGSDGKKYSAEHVDIHPEHQRKGLATAMYSAAEEHLGESVHPDGLQTPEASALWSQPNRPFGKSAHDDQIPGGLADKKSPKDFDREKLKAGVLVEREHTSDSRVAMEIAMDHLTEDPDYYEKLKTIEKSTLEKGAPQRLMPYRGARELGPTEVDDISSWVGEEGEVNSELREKLPAMHPDAKARGLRRIAAKTKWRRNPDSGEAEFLLHRGVGPDEGLKSHQDRHSSWTPNYDIAHGFGSNYKEDGRKGSVLSAWIPESDIHTIPNLTGGNLIERWDGRKTPTQRDEWEVVVRPGHKGQPAKRHEIPSVDPNKNIKTPDDIVNARAKARAPMHSVHAAKAYAQNRAKERGQKKPFPKGKIHLKPQNQREAQPNLKSKPKRKPRAA